jgi:hypothetical protein
VQDVRQAVPLQVSQVIPYYDKHGLPVEMLAWASLFGDMEYRRVGSTEVGEYWVSTVWLGIDHSWGFGDAPLIFETMVFKRDAGFMDEYMDRYSTEAQAFEGHLNVVGMLAALSDSEPVTLKDDTSWLERLRDS